VAGTAIPFLCGEGGVRVFGIRRAVSVALLCVGSASLVGASGTPSIYYKDQRSADLALLSFGPKNPACEAWTNWQKVCVRSLKATTCAKDPDFQAKPSLPFCIGLNIDRSAIHYLDVSPDVTKSQLRFCKNKSYLYDENQIATNQVCRKYDKFRPFAKIDRSTINYSWCSEFTSEKENGYAAYQCVKWNLPTWCRRALISGGFSKKLVSDYPAGALILNDSFNHGKTPVYSIYCVDRLEVRQ
jgi:hypothetical protein